MNRRVASLRIEKHETNRQCGGVGSAPSSGRGFSSGTEKSHGSGETRGGGRVERQTLEAGLEGGWRRRAPVEADSRSSREADDGGPAALGPDRTGRSALGGLHDRLVDLQAGGGSDSPRVRRDVPPGPRRPLAAHPGFHAAEAAASGRRAKRGGDRAVAHRRLAANQKKARRRYATVVFLDETGFLLQPV